eukprot:UN06858
MQTLAWLFSLGLFSFALGDYRLSKYRISDTIPSKPQLLHVNNEDLSSKSTLISKHLSLGSAILCEKCNHKSLTTILKAADYPISPAETIEFMMLHWYINANGYKIYHIKEYDTYKLINGSIRSSNGDVTYYYNTPNVTQRNMYLFDKYITDVLDYAKQCAITSNNNKCSTYISNWYKKHGFNDQNGMQPTNGSTVWGKIETTLYYDGIDSFNSLIPYNTYIYADANPFPLELQNIV